MALALGGDTPNQEAQAFASPPELNVAQLEGLRPGDVVFIAIPDAFWARMASEWSLPRYRHGHVGILVKTGMGTILVVHAGGNPSQEDARVVAVPLREFARGAARLDVFRPTNENAAPRAARIAKSFADARLRFDTKFSLATTKSLYCTELVWRSLSAGYGWDILPVKSRVAGYEAVLLSDLEIAPQLRLYRTLERGQPNAGARPVTSRASSSYGSRR